MDTLNDKNTMKYEYLTKCCEKYNKEELKNLEDNIFKDASNSLYSDYFNEKKHRAIIEFKRIEKKLDSDHELLLNNYENFIKLSELFKVLSFNKTLIDEVYKTILNLDLDLGLKIRLFSAVPGLKQDYDLQLLQDSFNKTVKR